MKQLPIEKTHNITFVITLNILNKTNFNLSITVESKTAIV